MLVRTIFTALMFSSVAAFAQVVALPGTVVGVEENKVSVEVCSYEAPRVHDLLEIGFKKNQGNELTIGVWRVVEVSNCFLRIAPVCEGSMPAVGQGATVFLNTSMTAPPVTVQSGGEVGPRLLDPAIEIETSIRLLNSGNSREKQTAAKVLYRHYRYEPLVQKSAEAALLEGFMLSPSDAYHVDAMSWLCNILGASGDPSYKPTLAEVEKTTPAYKLSRYAGKNLRRLR